MTRKNQLFLPSGWNTRQGEWGIVDLAYELPSLSEIKLLAKKRTEHKDKWFPGEDRNPETNQDVLARQIMGETVATEERETYTRRWIGLYGERQVARELAVRMHLDVRRRGDKRANLTTQKGVPVDVITRRSPHGWADRCPDLLLHELDAERPELALVLVIFCGSDYDAYVVGWEWEGVVRKGAKLTNHQGHTSLEYPPEKLRMLSELRESEPYEIPARQAVLV
jgi:hypothetical protein